MRYSFFPLAAVLALAACSSVPGQPGVTVEGRGVPAADVEAVQRAVDQGGTVLLRGTFDFGDRGNVTIKRDVTIMGEADASGAPLTLVKGGFATFRSLPAGAGDAPGPKITIKSLRFEGALWMPMQLAHTSGATVSGTVVTNVRVLPMTPGPISGGKPYNMQHAVVVGGVAIDATAGLRYSPALATGVVRITDNFFDLANGSMRDTIAQAVFIVQSTGIDAEIARNKIRNVSRNAIEVIENVRSADGAGRIVIRENDIETPVEGTPMPSPRTPNGILVGYFLNPRFAMDDKVAIDHSIVGNRIRMRGRNPAGAWGVAVMANRVHVTDNQITLDAPDAIGISVSGANGTIARNRIGGEGALGIGIGPFPPMTASHNQLVDNDLARLKAAKGHVGIGKGANTNRISGSAGTVTDMGEGNSVGDLKPFVQAAR